MVVRLTLCSTILFWMLISECTRPGVSSDFDYVQYQGDRVVFEGKGFSIRCIVSQYETIKWQKNATDIIDDELGYKIYYSSSGSRLVSDLVVANAKSFHSGSYRCDTLSKKSHRVFVLSANAVQPNCDRDGEVCMKLVHFNKDLQLQCNVSDSSPEQYTIGWFKNNVPVPTDDTSKYTIKKDENSLVIHHATESDAGYYKCQVNLTAETEPVEMKILVATKPTTKLPKNTNLVEGEKLELNCSITGFPVPNITWVVGNETYEESRDRVILKENVNHVHNAIFIIEEAVLADRGDFKCMAENLANASSTTTFLRVKDKYAALWPFLGICAEVAVLCAIIFIYEKKRNKAEMEESDTDQSPEQKNTPDHGKDSDVRQRK